jgi:hypothetical protein
MIFEYGSKMKQMNDKDKEAFDEWFIKTYRYDYKDLVIPESINPQKEAWLSACEYMRNKSNPLDALSLHEKLEKEREENKKLREALEMVMDNTKMPHHHSDLQTRLWQEIWLLDCLAERAREALKEIKGE